MTDGVKRAALLAGRLLLGAVFAVAAIPKIADPPAVAHMIANYRLLPAALVHPAALVLPWIEITCGVLLVTGLFRKTAAKLVAAMLVVFVIAIGVNLARDRAVQCGCFDVHAAAKTHAELIGEMRWVLVRDAALLAVAAFVLAGGRRPRRGAALAALLVLAGCRQAPARPSASGLPTHALRGVIVGIDPARRELTVRHGAIPGFMPAMTMQYAADPSVRLDQLEPGDEITARIVAAPGAPRLDEISVVDRKASPGEAARIDPAKIAAVGAPFPDFHLVDQDGRTVMLSAFRGRPVVLSFVYTRCPLPWACPATIGKLARVGAADPATRFLVVTVDPANDTPAVLRDYSRQVDMSGGRWTFATGDPAEIARVAEAAGALFERDGTAITHSLVAVAIGPDGRVLGRREGREWKPEDVLADLRTLRE
ncbi:MAG TPA: MauE/DoxX family redox-associated membrane protein [Thermoanaerobaculia bacterium]|nr:MauE/DoxX family redox-associated membrane protein [Thermoanaerobaculia bacterium]